ncbi:MAG: hypothetical protein WCK18_02580 [Prolixibacteraceae bacterium]|jgi:hypothetical protein
MKCHFKPYQLLFLLLTFGFLSIAAHPRIIKGTVYRDGKPASGVQVSAHKAKRDYFTSFDGKYELKADMKSKWIKFTFNDKVEIINLDANSGDVIDFGAPVVKSEVKTESPVKK